MIVVIKMTHPKEKRTNQVEIFGIDSSVIAGIIQSDSKYKNQILDRYVKDFISGKIPPSHDGWNIVDWEFKDNSYRGRNRAA